MSCSSNRHIALAALLLGVLAASCAPQVEPADLVLDAGVVVTNGTDVPVERILAEPVPPTVPAYGLDATP